MRKVTVASFVHDGLLHFRLVEYSADLFPMDLNFGNGSVYHIPNHNCFYTDVPRIFKYRRPKQLDLFDIHPVIPGDIEILKITCQH